MLFQNSCVVPLGMTAMVSFLPVMCDLRCPPPAPSSAASVINITAIFFSIVFLTNRRSSFQTDAAINRDHHAVDVSAGARRQINRRAGHVRRLADAPQRAGRLERLLVLFEQPLCHLTRKWAGGDGVDCDVALAELDRQHA